jgi:MFS family permease
MAEVHDATPTTGDEEKGAERVANPIRQSRAGSMAAATNLEMIEAPVTWKAYLLCAFASFGGIFFGYDSGYINGVTGSAYFISIIEGPNATSLSGPHNSLIVSILSAGTFFGAIIAGDCADRIGRRNTIVIGCGIYVIGVILQIASHGLGLLVAGRLIAGIGVGFESAIVILYMSEIVRSASNFLLTLR